MNLSSKRSQLEYKQLWRQMIASFSLAALIFSTLIAPAQAADQRATTRRLSEDQRAQHVLNRLGFGPRPGDIERVKRMGVERYIDEQLHPEKIADNAMEARLGDFPTLNMTSPELYAKYPNPGMLVRQLQRSGELPPELASLGSIKAVAKTKATGNNDAASGAANSSDGAAMVKGESGVAPSTTAANATDKKDDRQALRAYYAANNLQLPQKITTELQASRIVRAVYSERQLQEAMVDFWSNHFNIYAGKGADRWMLTAYDRDTIRPHAMGSFYDLLVATAESPAMLFYLDNFQSVSPQAVRQPGMGRKINQLNPLFERPMRRPRLDRFPNMGTEMRRSAQQQQTPQNTNNAVQQQKQRPKRGINENYARELMELHTLGVDGGYTQKDVQEVARCFTGWTINQPRGGAGAMMGEVNEDAGKFFFNPRMHDDGEKTVLGHKIPAGGGMKDGLMVLDILAHQPATAHFVATKLARRFVMDNPSPALVDRVAAAFTRSNGDIKETLRAIFTSPEFNSTDAYRAKIKTPFELAVSAVRAVGGETNGGAPLHQWISKMGEPLYQYQAPTGYPDTADAWVNTGSLLERLNFALALVNNRIPGTRVDLTRFIGDAATASAPVNKDAVVDQFIKKILQNDVSPQTKTTLLRQLNEPANQPANSDAAQADAMPADAKERRALRRAGAFAAAAPNVNQDVAKIAGLILGAPEFQRQ